MNSEEILKGSLEVMLTPQQKPAVLLSSLTNEGRWDGAEGGGAQDVNQRSSSKACNGSTGVTFFLLQP